MKPPTLRDRLWAAFLRFDDGIGGLLWRMLIPIAAYAVILILLNL
jgi:hypothetical protein